MKDTRYLKLILVPFIFMLVSGLIIIFVDYLLVKNIVFKNIEALKNSYVNLEKKEAKIRVDYIIRYIKNIQKNFPNLSKKELEKLAIDWIKENQNKNKYIFVYKLLNKNGGDKFAIMLINPNRKDLEGKYLSTNYKDIKGNRFREVMLKNVLEKNETFVTYFYKKPDSNKIVKKVSFFKYFKDFNWIIATGVYFDIKNQIIKKYESKILKEQKKAFFYLLIIIFVLALISIIFLWFIFNKLKKSIIEKNQLILQQSEQLRKEASEKEEYLKKLKKDYEIIKKLQNENEKLILSLEEKVKEKVEELRKKDKILMQQSKMAAMGEMIANIAHQWRQPLNVLSTLLITLSLKKEMGNLRDEDIDKCIKEAENVIDNMSKTIDNFQNFFSPNREKEEFNIKEAILEALEIIKPILEKKNIKVDVKCNDYFLIGYKNDLKQVLLVILNNAIDVISNKGIEGLIFIECEVKDGVILKIRDNGGGIPEDIKDRIFEPYFTTKHKAQGIGIGLYMALEIITKHFNGNIEVENVEYEYNGKIQKGAEFIIKIPK